MRRAPALSLAALLLVACSSGTTTLPRVPGPASPPVAPRPSALVPSEGESSSLTLGGVALTLPGGWLATACAFGKGVCFKRFPGGQATMNARPIGTVAPPLTIVGSVVASIELAGFIPGIVTPSAGVGTIVYTVTGAEPPGLQGAADMRVDVVVLPSVITTDDPAAQGLVMTFRGPRDVVEELTGEIGSIASSSSTTPPLQ